MVMVEPLKFRTMRKEGKNGKAVDIGDVLTNYYPSMTGWVSDRFAIYPQTLILQFEKPVIITKIQILAHRLMVPEKITLSLGECGSSQVVSLRRATFSDPIGDIIFNDPNDEASLDARELKNVEISGETEQFINFLCMDVYRNYPSKENKYNQVCLIAMSVLGRTIDSVGVTSDAAANFLCDLASLVYVDPEITENIQKLRDLKNSAATLERFTLADKARAAIASLREIGYEHGSLLVESDKAQRAGDVQRARELKTLADSIKLQTILDIQMNDLLLNKDLFKENEVAKN